MNSAELHYHFDQQKFDTEYRELIAVWEKTWVRFGTQGQTTGPSTLRARPGFLTANDQPEVDAVNRLIEYAASAIVLSHAYGESNTVMDRIRFIFPQNRIDSYAIFLEKVMLRVLALQGEKNKKRSEVGNSEVTALRDLLRAQLNNPNLSFGADYQGT